MDERQRGLITANWGKLNLSRKEVKEAKARMVAALSAASQGSNIPYLTHRATSTSLAAEQVRLALQVFLTHLTDLLACLVCSDCEVKKLLCELVVSCYVCKFCQAWLVNRKLRVHV